MLTVLLALTACSPDTPEVPAAPEVPEAPAQKGVHVGVDMADPEACAACHGDIVTEWKESMHARAHHDNDPVYGAMRELRMKKQGEKVGRKCQNCHNPLSKEDPDTPAGKVGVACGACHTSEDADAGESGDGRTVCLTCHDATKNPAGVAACTTGPENGEAGEVPCAACHLPKAEDGHARHIFAGPHRAWYQDDPSFLKQAVATTLEREGGKVTVTVRNITGHAMPTGFPGRVAAIRLADPESDWAVVPDELVFKKVYVDADGKPTLPPFSSALKVDSRLTPGEARTVQVDVPDTVKTITASLVFRLAPPPAFKALGLEGTPESEPRAVLLTKTE